MTSDNAADTDSAAAGNVGRRRRGGMSRRSRWSMLIAAITLIALIVALNWPYQFTRVAQRGSANQTSTDFDPMVASMPVMAGWPYRYWIHYAATDSGAPQVDRFSSRALAYNLALSGTALLCLMYYLVRRERKHESRTSRLSIADLMVLTLILAAPFTWWQQAGRRNNAELQVAAKIKQEGGSHQMTTWIPETMVSWFPDSLTMKLQRLHTVQVESPSDELMSQLVDQRELTMLRVGGGDYDLALLHRLVANPHLVDLRIAGRVLDAATMQSIAANQRLHTLNLMRTNVSAEALQRLDQLPNLRRMSLIHSDVVLSELGTPNWSRTIRQLSLGHPDPGEQAGLRLEGWPELQTLSINEMESQLNSTAMTVELIDLPELNNLYLDVFQKFDLTLHNLPKLDTITPLDFQFRSRLPHGGVAPSEIWCGGLDVDGLPELKRLSFLALGLKHLRIRNAPQLDWLGVAAFYKTQSTTTYAAELTPETATALISGLGDSEGPPNIDLDAVPLAGVDLAPLAGNKGIRSLLLSHSGTELEQWKALDPMKWLVRLDVKDCPIDDEGIQWLLDTFPNLQHCAFSPGSTWSGDIYRQGASGFEIVDRPNLCTLDFGNLSTEFLTQVRVINSPNLKLDLALGFVEKLEISGAPSLTGLRVRGPVPSDAKFDGVRDLRFFAVGGPTVTDDFIAPLSDCKSLQTLTLAYPAVTADGLKQLSHLSSIQSLNLPGASVDDSVVTGWPEMPSLRQLDLRDTSITGASLRRLLSGVNATRVLLDRTQVSKEDLDILSKHPRLTELSLEGIGIEAKVLSGILAKGSLSRLNLSGSDVTPEILDAIAEAPGSLVFLGLRDCQLDEARLRSIASRNRNLQFDLSGSTVSTQLMTALLSAHRVVDQRELEQRAAMQTMNYSNDQADRGDPAVLDTTFFAELAAQTAQSGSAVPGGPVSGSTTIPIGNRIGRWLGGVPLGPPTVNAEASGEQPSDEAETGSSDAAAEDSAFDQSSSEEVVGDDDE